MRQTRTPFSRIVSVLLVLCICFGLVSTAFAANAPIPVNAPDGKILIQHTDYQIADGVTETDVFLNTAAGNQQIAGYMTTVAPGAKATFKASYMGYYTAGSDVDDRRAKVEAGLTWGMQKTTDQAKAYEDATGGNVIMATNGDYYNMQTLQPLGTLVMEGNLVQMNNGLANEPYFAVLKDGTFVIREAGTDTSDVQEAVSGPIYLVKNGEVNHPDLSDELIPVNSIGMKADGTVITFVADGRQYPYSVGMTQRELAYYMQAQGCVTALYLDGGGSATCATKREGTTELTVRNRPSDGAERTVASAILLVSTASSDGVFDHASLTPNNETYTPGSSVQFAAAGVDVAGGPADVPATVTWELEDATCGTIEAATGVFTAAEGFKGAVTVKLMNEGACVGTTTVQIADIDELYFTGSSISLDFGAVSDLGLNAKNSGHSINYKDGDFEWTITPTTDGLEAAQIGSIANNLFTAGMSDSTMTCDVQCSYKLNPEISATIEVEVGKMPVTVFDFEEQNGEAQKVAHYHWGKNSYVNDGQNPDGGYWGDVSPITVFTSGTYTGSPATAELTAPYSFTGNWDSSVPAADIFHANGYNYYLWPNGTITQYMAGNAKCVTEAEGGKVKFGDYSLELDYDYESYDGSKNANFYLRYCGDRIDIEGYPTEVGTWIYAPEGTAPYMTYIDIGIYQNGDYTYKNYVLQHKTIDEATGEEKLSGNIDWTGWMYCYADITDCWSYQSDEHPLSFIPGNGGMLWLSFQPAGNPGGRKNGTLYFDNLRLVYGTNLDDLDNPLIHSVAINGSELAKDGSTVIDSTAIEAIATYSDYEGANASGIEATATTVLIDGVVLENRDASDTTATARLTLGNGKHVITIRAFDAFGNVAEEIRGFTVDSAENGAASVTITGADFVPLGGAYDLTVDGNGKVASADVTMMQLNDDIGEPVVTFADGVTGTYTYEVTGYKKAMLTLHLDVAEPTDGSKTLATLSFNIAASLNTEVNSFTYIASHMKATDDEGATNTSALPSVRLPLSAYYILNATPQVVGMNCTISAVTRDGDVAADVEIFIDGVSVGTTDAEGNLTTDAMAGKPGETVCTLSAIGPDGVAEDTKITVLNNAIVPPAGESIYRAIHQNTSADNATQQSISWMTPTFAEPAAKLQYRLAGTEEWTEVDGDSTLTAFQTTKSAAYVNTVVLEGLTPDTDYEFCVSDGVNDWSDTEAFHTLADEKDTYGFFVMGDTQMSGVPENDAEALGILQALGGLLDGKQVDFGLQTGDYVDNGANYPMWEEIQDVFADTFPGVDLVHTLGNHETYGIGSSDISSKLLQQLGNQKYYSLVVGDVYIAIINNNADLEEAAAWLIEDAQAHACLWKIMAIHEPPYPTNGNDGARTHDILAPAIQEAGIDAVFTGHDHAYARTRMLDNTPVEEGGVTYFICGDLGEKSRSANYAISSDYFKDATDPTGISYATQEYDGLMLYASAGPDKMTVTAYNSDGMIVDEVEIGSRCAAGHDFSVYKDGKVICSRCSAEAPEDFTGWVTVYGTEDRMYFLAGVYCTGFQQVGDTMHHFGEDGIVHVTETIDTHTCTHYGRFETTCQTCGATFNSASTWPEGHKWDENHVCTVCGFQGIDIATCKLEIDKVMAFNGGATKSGVLVTDEANNYVLNVKTADAGVDGYLSYVNNDAIGTATVKVDGMMDYYGTISDTYKIIPADVTNFVSGDTRWDSIDLTWDAVAGAQKYGIVYSTDGETWIPIDEIEGTTYTVTGLTRETQYQFRIYAYTLAADGEEYRSADYSPILTVSTPDHPHEYTDTVTVPTCTEQGITIHVCFVCGYTFADSYVDALGHNWGEGVTVKEATENEAGEMSYICARCGATKTEEIAPLGHSFDDTVTAPTCTEKGYTTHACACGYSYIDSFVDTIGHTPVADAAVAPTCTETGLTEGSHCSVCDAVLTAQEVVPALGHTYTDTVTAATCTENGYTTHVCACGYSYVDTEVSALGHDWNEGVVTKEPTETEAGEKTYTCSRCDATKTEAIAPLGHTHVYVDTVTEPTCTAEGFTTHTCACGDSYVDNKVAALGHVWDKGVVTTEATATAPGMMTYTCTRCGETKTEEYKLCDGGSECPGKQFKDMPAADNWAHEGIDYVLSNGLFKGTSDDTFSPNEAMTRAMLVTVLWRNESSPEGAKNTFSDVADGKWFTTAIAWAAENKIVDGVGEGKFNPDGKVTREQLAKILFSYAAFKEIDNTARETLTFTDSEKISSWATDAFQWAVAAKLISGSEKDGKTYADPKSNATRAQVAVVLMRFLENVAK